MRSTTLTVHVLYRALLQSSEGDYVSMVTYQRDTTCPAAVDTVSGGFDTPVAPSGTKEYTNRREPHWKQRGVYELSQRSSAGRPSTLLPTVLPTVPAPPVLSAPRCCSRPAATPLVEREPQHMSHGISSPLYVGVRSQVLGR